MKAQNLFYSLCFSFFCLGITSVYAQSPSPIHVGIKAGANFTDISTPSGISAKSAAGYGIGAMARLDIKKAYLQADLMFSEKNIKVEGETSKMKNIEVPVVIGYKFINLPLLHLRGYAGGVYTNIVDNNFSKGEVENTFNNFDKSNIGYRLGIGADILKFTVDVSYDGGFGNISKDFKSKPNTFFISVGYFFL